MNRQFRFAIFVIMFGLILAFPGNASASTYYISSASGSDSNSASQAQVSCHGNAPCSPWAHFPGMANATGNAANYTPQPGDTFILRGCDSWLNASFPINWTYNGSSSAPITVTADKTWFNTGVCASAWNRPIFDQQNAAITAAGSECGGAVHNAVIINTGTYTTFAWIEDKNFAWAGSCQLSAIAYHNNSAGNITYDNWYVHAFNPVSGTSNDNPLLFWVQFPSGTCGLAATGNCTLSNSIINNCDVAGSGQIQYGGGLGGLSSIGNIYSCLSNAMKPYGNGIIANNSTSRIATVPVPSAHLNSLEIIGSSGTGIWYVHDNYFVSAGSENSEMGAFGNPNETDYVWNNVWYINSPGQSPSGPQSGTNAQLSTSWSWYFWNNTVWANGGCIAIYISPQAQILNYYVENNHCINNNGFVQYLPHGPLAPTGSSAISNNIVMSISTAASQGYTAANNFAPTAPFSTNATPGQGANLSSLLSNIWPNQISGTNLTNLTASNPAGMINACQQQTVSGVIESVCPTSPPNARGSSWDIGAYQWSASAAAAPPSPPTGLTTTVQ